MNPILRRERPDRQPITIAITPDLLEQLHSGTHFLAASPSTLEMSAGSSAARRTKWGQIKPSQRGQPRPSFPAQRITQLRDEKEQIETALRELQPSVPADHTSLTASLERLPDLSRQLRDATPEVKRALFDAFELRIVYDKTQRRVQISATVTEAVAQTLQNAKDLPTEALAVPQRVIAGERFVLTGNPSVLVERVVPWPCG